MSAELTSIVPSPLVIGPGRCGAVVKISRRVAWGGCAMKLRVGEFVDLYEDFAERGPSEQIVRLIYFHTVLEQRETISKDQIARLFDFAELPCPKNLPQLLSYLHREGKKLLNKKGEFSLHRS